MARIAVGGFGHETNSFITHRADFAYFAEHRDRPPFVAGDALLARFAEGSLPLCGFLKEVETRHSLVPLVWAHGSAGGTVTDDAFERIVGEMVAMLSKALPVDAVYLDLHGAMTTDYFQDAEGEILRRVRAAAGDVPIVASLDYHANVTPEMVALADSLVAFRSYPHVDRPETGRRASRVLEALLANGRPAGRAFRSLPFMIPLTSQCTLVEPSRTVVAASRDLEGAIVSLAYAAGFPQSDLYWCGPSVFCHAETQAAADENADNLAALIVAREPEFVSTLFAPREGVARALDLMASASRTVVIADVQDNPGAGGSGDTTGILRELLRANATGAVLGIFCDPDAAQAAHDAGEGAAITLPLGGRYGPAAVEPLQATCRVKRLGTGRFRLTGAVAAGSDADLGPMALLSLAGVDIVVASRRMQAYDQAPFFHLDIDPREAKLLVLKSSVHFRAEFEPIAEAVLLVAAPGLAAMSVEVCPYRHLRDGVRLEPKGRPFKGCRERPNVIGGPRLIG